VISFGHRVKCKEKNSNNLMIGIVAVRPWTASHKGGRRSLVCSEKLEEWPDAVRSSLLSSNYKVGGMCRQQGRFSNAEWRNTATQHQLSGFADSLTPQDGSTERNKTNKGQHSRENKERWRGKRMHGKLPRNLDEIWSIINGLISS
jgi:hypothetical protein